MTPPTPQNQSKLKQGVIRLNIEDLKDLYQAYMPFVDGCGIFVATEEKYALEQEVFIFLKLPGDLGKFAASGRIVWLHPPKKSPNVFPALASNCAAKKRRKSAKSSKPGSAKCSPAACHPRPCKKQKQKRKRAVGASR